MNNYIIPEKRSKKRKREYYSKNRILWDVNPGSRTINSGKEYKRSEQKSATRRLCEETF